MVTYVFGHKNPDTDSICSSIVYGNHMKDKGNDIKIIKLGEINNETKFLLEKFVVDEPQTMTNLEKESNVILLDHNEKKQSIDNIDELRVINIIDHHKFNFNVADPLYIRAEPLGSACSIVAKILFEENAVITKTDASLLIAGIISDTLYFRSPTTAPEDKDIIKKLNEIANIEDLETFSLEMFDAKSDLGDMDVEKLIKLDYKEFDIADKKFGIGFMETTSPDYGLNRRDEIVDKLKEIKEKDNLDIVFLSVVDILSEKNFTIFSDEDTKELLTRVFDAKIDGNNIADLGNIISRKKQVVPSIEKNY